MEDRNLLNVSDQDVASTPNKGGRSLDELVQLAVAQKAAVDGEFQKVATAADSAVAAVRNPSSSVRDEA